MKANSRMSFTEKAFRLLLSLFFSKLLVRFIFLKFHSYFNQHKMSVIAAFCLPFLLLFLSLFVKLDNNKKRKIKSRLSYFYPHVTLPVCTISNCVRIILQTVYLAFFKTNKASLAYFNTEKTKTWQDIKRSVRILRLVDIKLVKAFKHAWFISKKRSQQANYKRISEANIWQNQILKVAFIMLLFFAVVVFVTVPFSVEAQAVFISLILIVAYTLRRVEGQIATITMITLSVTTSTRYLWWRYTETLNWADPLALALGIGLLLAETYAWLVLILGFFQTINPLNRKPVQLPEESTSWPTVDIYIPTYNEPLSVVKPTTIAAQSIDWPADKLNIYILDDGKRPEFAEFAKQIGVGYIARPDNNHAKAGNMNHAMRYTDGEYIAIFDCDHIPARSFLQMTMGQFIKDEKVCLVQTPHHFFQPIPLSET